MLLGHRVEGRVIPTVRLVAIAPTDAEAAEMAREGAKWMLRTYVNPTGERGDSAAMVQRYVDSMVIHGTAPRVVDKIARLHEEILWSDEAKALLDKLPLGQAGLMEFQFIPLGPLSPLRALLAEPK